MAFPPTARSQAVSPGAATGAATAPATVTMSTVARGAGSSLVIGPGDELDVTVYGAPDLSGHTRVGSDGNISLPLVGYVHIAGLSSDQAQQAISQQLQEKHVVKEPQVSVFVKEYTNSEISVAGEVAKPGVFSVLGPHRLLDVLEAAGGLTEKASNSITISHRSSDDLTTVRLSNDPAQMARANVELQPGDTVVVPQAGIVYVLGEVNKPGGYALNSSGGVTLLQVLAAAGGPTHLAAVSGTKMVRRTPTGLTELSVPMKDLLRAKAADIPMNPGDIVYVPSSKVKSALNAGALASSAGAAAIYRIP
jgi:polysaccharide biosynthesis/export protein